MSQRKLTIVGTYQAPRGFLYREYVYRVPEPPVRVPLYDFTGKPLEQIEREYGRQVAVMVYQIAAAGRCRHNARRRLDHTKNPAGLKWQQRSPVKRLAAAVALMPWLG